MISIAQARCCRACSLSDVQFGEKGSRGVVGCMLGTKLAAWGGRRVDGLSWRAVSVTISLTSQKQKGIQVHLMGYACHGGDFNAELGTQQPAEESVVGPYSSGSRSRVV
eukprot:5530809-Amphidinium_carterae.1